MLLHCIHRPVVKPGRSRWVGHPKSIPTWLSIGCCMVCSPDFARLFCGSFASRRPHSDQPRPIPQCVRPPNSFRLRCPRLICERNVEITSLRLIHAGHTWTFPGVVIFYCFGLARRFTGQGGRGDQGRDVRFRLVLGIFKEKVAPFLRRGEGLYVLFYPVSRCFSDRNQPFSQSTRGR